MTKKKKGGKALYREKPPATGKESVGGTLRGK